MTVSEFLGVDRNRVQGQADGVLAPTRLFNLVPDRRGGYVPFGRRVSKGVTLADLDRLVGYDEGGLFTMTTAASGAGKLVLNKGVTSYAQDVPNYPDLENAAHLALAGSYISRDRFLVLNRENIKAQPVKLAVEAAPITASVAGVLTIGTTRINDVAFGGSAGNERWILVNEAGEIYRSTDDTGRDWETTPVFTAPDKLGGVAYGNGRWVVVGGDATPLIYYADDTATDTWTAATFPGANQGFDKVAFDIGTLSNGSTFIASGNEIFRSTDNGTSWVEVDDTHDGFANNWRTGPIAIHANNYITIIIEGDYRGGIIDGSEVTMVSTDGITWNGSGLPPWDAAFDIAVSTDGIFVAVTETGEVWSSSDPSAFASWIKHADNIMGSGQAVRAVCFNANTNSWFVAGYSGTVMESVNLAAWTPVEFGEGASEMLYAIGAATDGTVVAAGDSGRVMVGYGTSGLPVGTYEVVTIAYFNTRAGKFVFNIGTHEVSFPDRGDNTISIKAPTREKVAADTLADVAYGYTPSAGLLDDIHIDVFLKYDPNAIGNVDEVEATYSEIVNEPVTVYDFTASLSSGAAGATVEIGVIEETPLGSQLGGGQGVTTIAYEQPETALHGGRMWGMASQEQARYPSDDVSLEIANVFGNFVLSYTEPGWANLIRPDNYLPLRPTQSTTFTGILSTPAGVMVFFDNEVFVVNGDAALGTLQFDLYPDIVGNDEGATPCKLGGVPFCVWKGKIYALVGGRVEDVSGPVFRQDDKFIQIAPEPQEGSLLALTESGGVWRYDFSKQFWSNNVVSDDVVQLLPNCNCVVGDNTLYADASGDLFVARRDGTPDTPSITYRGIDFGDPRARSALYRVMLPIEGLLTETNPNEGGSGNFGNHPLGESPPTGWEVRRGDWTVVTDSTAPTGAAVEIAGGYSEGAELRYEAAGFLTDVDVLVLMRLLDASHDNTDYGGALARSASLANSDDEYYRAIIAKNAGAWELQIRQRETPSIGGATDQSVASVALEFTPATDEYIVVRFNLEGSSLRAKAWRYGIDEEPADWQVSAVDSDPDISSGRVGFNYGWGTTAVVHFAALAFGTGGTAAEFDLGFIPENVPQLFYEIANGDGDIDDLATVDNVLSRRLEELFTWRLPLGTKSRYIDLRFELNALDYDAVVTPDLQLVYADSGSVR